MCYHYHEEQYHFTEAVYCDIYIMLLLLPTPLPLFVERDLHLVHPQSAVMSPLY